MKTCLSVALSLSLAAALILPGVADAKRVGGGKNAGMQRSAPTQQAPNSPPAQQASPQAAPQQTAPQPAAAPAAAGATAAAAAAAPAKRSWLGPIAGLAAGLGLAALMSHLGMGEAFANFLMVALLVVAAIVVVRLLMRRFGGGAPARAEPSLATASAGSAPAWGTQPAPAAAAEPAMARSTLEAAPAATGAEVSVTGQPLRPLGVAATSGEAPAATVAPTTPAASGPVLPEGFDTPAFERVAKMIFIRLQAANDKADLDDLRQFTTPELFASLRLDLQERGSATQTTDVEQVEARIVDFATEEGRQIASVRFHGRIREEAGAPAEAFDEIWHLVKPESGGSWAIAGIQQAH
ncbi:MAG: TIM44-like domain-containing protein [Rubrivivax sp.]